MSPCRTAISLRVSPAPPLSRVRTRQGIPQVLDLHARVDGRRLQPLVTEQLLDVPHVGAASQQVRGAGVAQHVGRDPRPNAGPLRVPPHDELDRDGLEAPAVAREEERLLGGCDERAADGSPLSRDRGPRRARREREEAVLAALAAADEESPFAEIHVREVEAHALREPDAGAVERLEERAVPLADGGVSATVSRRGGRPPPA